MRFCLILMILKYDPNAERLSGQLLCLSETKLLGSKSTCFSLRIFFTCTRYDVFVVRKGIGDSVGRAQSRISLDICPGKPRMRTIESHSRFTQFTVFLVGRAAEDSRVSHRALSFRAPNRWRNLPFKAPGISCCVESRFDFGIRKTMVGIEKLAGIECLYLQGDRCVKDRDCQYFSSSESEMSSEIIQRDYSNQGKRR